MYGFVVREEKNKIKTYSKEEKEKKLLTSARTHRSEGNHSVHHRSRRMSLGEFMLYGSVPGMMLYIIRAPQ